MTSWSTSPWKYAACVAPWEILRPSYSALSAHSALTSATGASTTGPVGGRGPRLASAPRVVLGEHQHQGLLRHRLPHHEHQGSIVAIRMGLFEPKKMKNVQIFKLFPAQSPNFSSVMIQFHGTPAKSFYFVGVLLNGCRTS